MKKIITFVALVVCCVVSATATEGVAQQVIDATGITTQDNITGNSADMGDVTQQVMDASEVATQDSTTAPTDDEKATTAVVNKRLAARGYRGFINVTPIVATFINDGVSFSASTTHGYQIDERFFVGAGAGFHINLGNEGLGVAIPVYGAFRGNVGKRLAQFTYGARIGVAYADYGNFNSDTSVHNGETVLGYLNVDAGLRLGIARYFAIIVTPEVDIFVGKYNIVGMGLRIGFEF